MIPNSRKSFLSKDALKQNEWQQQRFVLAILFDGGFKQNMDFLFLRSRFPFLILLLFFLGCAANISGIPLQKNREAMIVQKSKSTTSIQAFSPDGRYALLTTFNGSKCTLHLWDFKINKILKTNNSETDWVSLSVFSPDNRFFLTSDGRGILKLWDTYTGKHIRTFEYSSCKAVKKYFDDICSIAFSSSGKYALTGGYSPDRMYVFRLWDIKTGKEITSRFLYYRGSIISAAFSYDDKDIISSECNYTNYVLRHNILLRDYSVIRNNSYVIAKSTNGRFLLTESGSSKSQYNILVWDEKNAKLQYLIKEGGNPASSCFSKDGRYVLMAFDITKPLRLFDASSGSILSEFYADSEMFDINNLAISSDNHYAFSSSNNTIAVWDVLTGKHIATTCFFDSGDWIIMTWKGYYDASDRGDHYLQIRIANKDYNLTEFRKSFYRPDLVKAALTGRSLDAYPSISDLKTQPSIRGK